MGSLYDEDVMAWAGRQAALLRAGQWSQLDIEEASLDDLPDVSPWTLDEALEGD